LYNYGFYKLVISGVPFTAAGLQLHKR
jgi:hypothetical protein